MRSLLIRSVGLVGLLEHESTDHFEGIAPVPFRVRPEPRRPGWDYRSPNFAGCQHSCILAPFTSVNLLSYLSQDNRLNWRFSIPHQLSHMC